MKTIFKIGFFTIVIIINILKAQDTILYPGLTGQQLLDSLVTNYKPGTIYNYDDARDTLYAIIDNHNDSVSCVYSGFRIYINPSADPSTDAYNKGINAEHSWPQSKGAASGNAQSDMHHLYPAKDNVNSSRGNSPFGEINDSDTDRWYRIEEILYSIPSQNIDEYSEKDNDPADGIFEPREDHKGNLARSMFYFYTMYKSEADAADANFFSIQKDILYNWHKTEPVDINEVDRTNRIASFQENKENPFVLDTTLVSRAYFSGATDNPPFNTSFINVSSNSFTIQWSLPGEYQSGVNQILILIQQGSAVDDDPTGSAVSTYTANSQFGSGDEVGTGSYVLYSGDGTSVNVTGLTENMNYHIKIWNTLNITDWSDNPVEDNQTAISQGTGEPGDIIISEIMQNPSAVSDDNGEWFEIYNASNGAINIDGWHLEDNGSDSHTIDNGGSLIISPGEFLVLGRNSTFSENGGVVVDYQYSGFLLSNSDDEVILFHTNGTTEIDRVEYNPSSGWPDPTGASMVFTGNESSDNNIATNWNTAGSTWAGGDGDYGSPGYNGSDQSLPVALISFSAISSAKGIQLKWSTASETNNQGFELYRKSNNDSMYFKIADYLHNEELAGQGNTNIKTEYNFLDIPVIANNTYYYKLFDVDNSGKKSLIGQLTISTNEENTSLNNHFELYGNYPNPFNSSTNIKLSIHSLVSSEVEARISIYNILGEKVRELYYGNISNGEYNFIWNGNKDNGDAAASGIYYTVISTKHFMKSHKMLLLK